MYSFLHMFVCMNRIYLLHTYVHSKSSGFNVALKSILPCMAISVISATWCRVLRSALGGWGWRFGEFKLWRWGVGLRVRIWWLEFGVSGSRLGNWGSGFRGLGFRSVQHFNFWVEGVGFVIMGLWFGVYSFWIAGLGLGSGARDLRFRVWGLGLGFGFWSFELVVCGLGFWVWGLRVWCSGFGIWSLWFRGYGSGVGDSGF